VGSIRARATTDASRAATPAPDGEPRAPGSSSSKGGAVEPDHNDRRDDDGDGSAGDHDGSASQSDSADPAGSAGHVRMPADPLLARFTEADRLREAGASKQAVDGVLNGGTVS